MDKQQKVALIIFSVLFGIGAFFLGILRAVEAPGEARHKAAWKAAFDTGKKVGAAECRAGYIHPSPDVLDALARRSVGVNYKDAFISGFDLGWDYPTVN